MTDIDDDLARLESAEAFFEYLDVPFDVDLVRVNRLHILKRFNQNIDKYGPPPDDPDERRSWYGALLARAHDDFQHSTPRQERIFKVFEQGAPGRVEVPLSSLTLGGKP